MNETGDPPTPPTRIYFLLGAAALVVVAGGLALIATKPPAPKAAPPAVVRGGEPSEDDVGRALRLAAIDSTKKNEWVDELPGTELGGLPAAKRERFLRFANAERCTCGCGFTLAACRRFDSTCEVSLPRVKALLDSAARGLLPEPRGLRERPGESRGR